MGSSAFGDECAAAFTNVPAPQLGPDYGEPLRRCAECSSLGEVGATDPDDGMWSAWAPDLSDDRGARRCLSKLQRSGPAGTGIADLAGRHIWRQQTWRSWELTPPAMPDQLASTTKARCAI